MRLASFLVPVCLSLVLPACGGVVDDDPDGDGRRDGVQQGAPGGGQPSGDPPTPETPASSTPETPPASWTSMCAAVEQGQMVPASQAEFIAAIVGVWSQCSDASFLGIAGQGLEIGADGRWWRLHLQGTELVRSQDPGEGGTWEVIDTTSMNGPGFYQLNLLFGDLTGMVHPALSVGPRKMRLGLGEEAVDFAMSGPPVQAPPVEPAPGVGPGGFPAAACSAVEGSPLAFSSVSALTAALLGSWSQCGETSVFGTSEDGLEIDASGRWYKLYTVGGVVVRGQGFNEEGTWEVLEGTMQLNLKIDGSGTVMVHPALSEGPRRMSINNFGVFTGDYAIDALEPPATP